uniref:Uncharacterized protein n=1 Tax=Glossina brevipalpis TaxID=37001 RepID=A0A1A9WXW5_9MUSC
NNPLIDGKKYPNQVQLIRTYLQLFDTVSTVVTRSSEPYDVKNARHHHFFFVDMFWLNSYKKTKVVEVDVKNITKIEAARAIAALASFDTFVWSGKASLIRRAITALDHLSVGWCYN